MMWGVTREDVRGDRAGDGSGERAARAKGRELL